MTTPPPPLRVLVVEDSVDHAFLLMSVLEARGHVARTAQDGQTALDLWDGGDFDAVLTDLNLPGMDGVELARALKHPSRDAFVVAFTGYTQGPYLEAARRSGADHVLTMPIDLGELVARVESLRRDARRTDESPVLAIATRPGDAVFGCGGTLVRHRRAGDDVVVLVTGDGPFGENATACARAAAEILDVEVRFEPLVKVSSEEGGRSLAKVVDDVDPRIAYIPTAADADATRRETHARGLASVDAVPEVLGYLTPTSTLDFRPDALRVVTREMPTKLDAVLALGDLADPALTGRFVQASARWWGRSCGYVDVEPFERMRR